MKIEYPQKSINSFTKKVLEHLETCPVAIIQPDDSPFQQETRQQLLDMHGFSCLNVSCKGLNWLSIINEDFPNIEIED